MEFTHRFKGFRTMSNAQIKSIALTTLQVTGIIIQFAAKAIVYVAIALYVVGELLFQEYAQSGPVPIEDAIPAYLDPWEVEEPAPATMAKSIARPGAVKSIALNDEILDGEKEEVARQVDIRRYQGMTSLQLRKECSAIGIRWRCAHGSKHLTKLEMFEALAA